jgi:hypothetical protein
MVFFAKHLLSVAVGESSLHDGAQDRAVRLSLRRKEILGPRRRLRSMSGIIRPNARRGSAATAQRETDDLTLKKL